MFNFAICESARCLHCSTPNCQEFCPLHNKIPQFLQLVNEGKYQQAVQIIGHPFGEICGYVCPHELQCQGGCVLSKRGSGVKVGEVERAVFAQYPYQIEQMDGTLRSKRIAVIGGGVAGVTFAAAAYQHGAIVDVFEKDKLLSTIKSIPSFRLPRNAIERIEEALRDKINVVYKNITASDFDHIKQNYDVVYVATGLNLPYTLRIDGEELAISYIDCLNGKLSGDVVIIGGGNTAIDCARIVARSGSNSQVVYRRTEEDMPAFKKEIVEAKKDGVDFCFNYAPILLQNVDNKLVLTIAKTVSEGRGKLTVTDETKQIVCDAVVSAVGGKFDKSILCCDGVANDSGYVIDNVYIGGDAKGGSLVVHAVADALNTMQSLIKG